MLSNDNIRIGGFHFKWDLFPCKKLSEKPNDLSRFNSLKDRFGVYIFFDETEIIPYIGLCGKKPDQSQYMKTRIGQYFKHDHDPGNTFATKWMKKNDKSYEKFKSYIAKCQLGTLSTCGNISEDKKRTLTGDTGVLGDMERFLIHTLTPAYNPFIYRLENDEENSLDCFVKSKKTAMSRIRCRKAASSG